MTFEHNGKQYRVRFHYAVQDGNGYHFAGRALQDAETKRVVTFCEIMVLTKQVNKDKDMDWAGIAGSFATRNPQDPFNKALGRKLAFTQALNQIADRQFRKTAWANYFMNHREPCIKMDYCCNNCKTVDEDIFEGCEVISKDTINKIGEQASRSIMNKFMSLIKKG